MKNKEIAFLILGIVSALIGIGCGIMAKSFFDLDRQFGDPGLGDAAFLFCVGAFLAIAGATVLFVKAFGGRRQDDFMRILAFIYGAILAVGGGLGLVSLVYEYIKSNQPASQLGILIILVTVSLLVIVLGFFLIRKAYRGSKAV
jgi:succinate dehydrogenase hydrophobic anchor subunit